uniref:NADH-ubiquinone oxidoreductase chain 6 n=1 Tax=Melanthalia intermedia TaxID=172989 RepID=A0A345UBP0_9FLOR|nr:NADH dehydrogenase subunit 6 [Melanthalia intermedia]AXI97876.1 NADH dehydrogenase subunit 6 [Melanthalia intermedia]
MQSENFLLIFFSSALLISSLMVVSSNNAVYSVLFLILVFCNVAGLLLLLGAEFLSFMLLIVYVGAIAVLFLFVVMMLNIKTDLIKSEDFSILPIGLIIFLILLAQLFNIFIDLNIINLKQDIPTYTIWVSESYNLTNIQTVGHVLYTEYSLLFILSGLILLIAMIGAIVLTMNQKTDIKKQRIELQLIRIASESVKFIHLRK